MATRNPVNSPVEVGSWNPIIYDGFYDHPKVVQDFSHQQILVNSQLVKVHAFSYRVEQRSTPKLQAMEQQQ